MAVGREADRGRTTSLAISATSSSVSDFGDHEHRVAIDGCVTVEEPAEMLDLADADRATVELSVVDEHARFDAAARRATASIARSA